MAKDRAKSKAKGESEAKRAGKAKARAEAQARAEAEAQEESRKESRLQRLLREYREAHPEAVEERFSQIESRIQSMPAGLICPFSVSIRGGRHNSREIEEVSDGTSGERITRYRGTSIEDDPEELRNADSLKQFCYRVLRAVGVNSPHLGIIVPAARRRDLYRAIAQVEANCASFNAQARTCELVFSYRGPLDSSGASSKSSEAVVLDQMARLLDEVDRAQHDSDEAVMDRAPQGSLPKGLTSRDVLTMAPADRLPIVARVRADLARKAVAEVQGYEFVLPEEASVPLTEAVEQIKLAAKAWVAGASEGEAELQQALKATDLSGLTRQQESLVRAAAMRRNESLQEAMAEAGVEQEQLELHSLLVPAADDGGGDGKAPEAQTVERGSAKPRRLIADDDKPKSKSAAA